MTAILKVDTIQDTAGNNIINESSDTITIGAAGDTTNIVGTLQNNGSALAVELMLSPIFKCCSILMVQVRMVMVVLVLMSCKRYCYFSNRNLVSSFGIQWKCYG